MNRDKLSFLNNLRTFMVFLVILYHAGGVYESSGFWSYFWLVDDPMVNDLSGIINIIIDVFVMSVIFFISGFLTPMSMEKRDARSFILVKARRLLIPWLIAVFTLVPLYKVIYLYSRNLPQSGWTSYLYFSNGIFTQSWLWYLPLLFLFSILLLLLRKSNIRLAGLSTAQIIAIFFVAGWAYSWIFEYFLLQGWTKTLIVDFQNERLLIYFLMFFLGSHCYDKKSFEKEVQSKKLYIALSALSWIPLMFYIAYIIFSIISPGSSIFSRPVDLLLKWLCFHLSLYSMLYQFVMTFRLYLNKENRFFRILNSQTYGVYIIHTIVLGLIATWFLGLGISSIGKYILLSLLTFSVCHLLVYLYSKLLSATKMKKFNNLKYNKFI